MEGRDIHTDNRQGTSKFGGKLQLNSHSYTARSVLILCKACLLVNSVIT